MTWEGGVLVGPRGGGQKQCGVDTILDTLQAYMKFSRNKSMSLRGDDLFWFSLGDFNERRGRISCQPGNRARETERGKGHKGRAAGLWWGQKGRAAGLW